jgi:hypothetical protein
LQTKLDYEIEENEKNELKLEKFNQNILIKTKKEANSQNIGSEGEELVRKWCQKEFPSYEIIPKNSEQGESDIHMKDKNGLVHVFECKNHSKKNGIPLKDVKKSENEIPNLKKKYGDKLGSYTFIGLNVNGIPNKGHSSEIINTVPVYWLPIGDDDISVKEIIVRNLLRTIVNMSLYICQNGENNIDNIEYNKIFQKFYANINTIIKTTENRIKDFNYVKDDLNKKFNNWIRQDETMIEKLEKDFKNDLENMNFIKDTEILNTPIEEYIKNYIRSPMDETEKKNYLQLNDIYDIIKKELNTGRLSREYKDEIQLILKRDYKKYKNKWICVLTTQGKELIE